MFETWHRISILAYVQNATAIFCAFNLIDHMIWYALTE